MHKFKKVPKKSYETVNSNMNRLGFLVNKMMFLDEQFELADKYKDKLEYMNMKFRFHVILGKEEEVIWSIVKIF